MDPAVKKLEVDAAVPALLNKSLKLAGFFPEFTKEHVGKIFPRSGLYFYPQRALVVEQEAPGRDLYVILHGRLAVFRRDQNVDRCIGYLKDGDIFGEIGLLRDGRRVATVIAQEDSKVFHLAYEDIRYLLKYNKDLGAHLDRLALERLKPGIWA